MINCKLFQKQAAMSHSKFSFFSVTQSQFTEFIDQSQPTSVVYCEVFLLNLLHINFHPSTTTTSLNVVEKIIANVRL